MSVAPQYGTKYHGGCAGPYIVFTGLGRCESWLLVSWKYDTAHSNSRKTFHIIISIEKNNTLTFNDKKNKCQTIDK